MVRLQVEGGGVRGIGRLSFRLNRNVAIVGASRAVAAGSGVFRRTRTSGSPGGGAEHARRRGRARGRPTRAFGEN